MDIKLILCRKQMYYYSLFIIQIILHIHVELAFGA